MGSDKSRKRYSQGDAPNTASKRGRGVNWTRSVGLIVLPFQAKSSFVTADLGLRATCLPTPPNIGDAPQATCQVAVAEACVQERATPT